MMIIENFRIYITNELISYDEMFWLPNSHRKKNNIHNGYHLNKVGANFKLINKIKR